MDPSRRNHGRRLLEGLMSSLGPVLDLSAGGMRILAKRKHKGNVTVKLSTADCELSLPARVAWSKRVGFREHMVGLEFLEVDAPTTAALSRMSSGYSKQWRLAS